MGKVVLIVEDDPKNMKLFRDLLDISGYTTIEAGDGEQGIRLAKRKRPDLILMDIQMPVMDGIEAAKILKADPETKAIPIIALTSHAMEGDRERIFQAGFDGYITKPVYTREFLKTVAAYL